MKILLDENVTVQLPLLHSLLQEKGYDVVAQRIIAPGVPDEDVIARATQLGRTIMPFDTDFPIHMFKYSRTVPFGVILIQESEDKVRPDDALMTRKLASAIDTIRDRESQRSIGYALYVHATDTLCPSENTPETIQRQKRSCLQPLLYGRATLRR